MARPRTKPADPVAEAVIAALGGDTEIAKELGAPVSTVGSWKTDGIPRWRRDAIKAVAARLGKTLPAEFLAQDAA